MTERTTWLVVFILVVAFWGVIAFSFHHLIRENELLNEKATLCQFEKHALEIEWTKGN